MADHRVLDPAARLREAREAKGLSLRQVADATKLSVRSIELLEKDSVDSLPEGIYRRAIIRAVASEVGLKPEQLLNEFTARHPALLSAPVTAVVAQPSARSSFQTGLAVISGMLPLVAGIVYFVLPMTRSVLSEPAPKPVAARAKPARAEVVPVGGFGDVPATDTRRVPVVVTLTISSRCQLRVVADGNEVVGRTVEQGETFPLDLGDELLLFGDNASAVQFSINGQAGRSLGAQGDALSVRIGRDDYQDYLVRH